MKPRSIFFFQAEDGLRYLTVTGVQTCALPISISAAPMTATVMNLLMTVAVIGAALIGQWPEAAVVIWLFGIAEMIEIRRASGRERAKNSAVAVSFKKEKCDPDRNRERDERKA